MTTNYTREEEARIVQTIRGAHRPRCPRCGARLARQDVPRPDGVPYVRRRVWLTCEGCGRSVVLDLRRLDPDP